MAENFANDFTALLNGAIDNDDTSVAFDNVVGTQPAVQFRILVQDSETDDTNREYMLVTAGTSSPWTVTRGIEGSTAVAHADNSFIAHVLTAGGLYQAIAESGGGGFIDQTSDYATAITSSTTAGVITVLLSRTLANLPAGQYVIHHRWYLNNVGSGRTRAEYSFDGTGWDHFAEQAPTHSNGASGSYRQIVNNITHPGGTLYLRLVHESEGVAITYGVAGDARFGRWQTVFSVSAATAVAFDLLHSRKPAADTPDDEFDSTTLAAKWTAVNGSAGSVNLNDAGAASVAVYDLATRPGWLLTQVGYTSGNQVRLRQDWTLPDGASIVVPIAPAIRISGTPGVIADEKQVGITLNTDDTTHFGATNLAVYALEVDAGLWDIQITSSGASSSLHGNVTVNRPIGQLVYLRVTRSGLTYRVWFSFDGATWVNLGFAVFAAALTNLWLFDTHPGATAGGPQSVVAWPWVRQGGNGLDPWDPHAAVSVAQLGQWQSYTPTWANGGGTTTLGNGTLQGRYKMLDAKTCLLHIGLTWGSTTSVTGAGAWTFSLPAGLVAGGGTGFSQSVAGAIHDSGSDRKVAVALTAHGDAGFMRVVPEGGNEVTGTVPMTWANGDQLHFGGTIEVQ